MLAAPMPGNNDHMMHEAVTAAAKRGLLQPHDHVVCVMSIKDSLVVKVVTMDNLGTRTMRHTDSAAGSTILASSVHMAIMALMTEQSLCMDALMRSRVTYEKLYVYIWLIHC